MTSIIVCTPFLDVKEGQSSAERRAHLCPSAITALFKDIRHSVDLRIQPLPFLKAVNALFMPQSWRTALYRGFPTYSREGTDYHSGAC